MKLHLFFFLIDALILMVYPVLYVIAKLRKFWKQTRWPR